MCLLAVCLFSLKKCLLPILLKDFFFFLILFIIGCAGSSPAHGEQWLLSSLGAQASYCSGFSCCRAQVLGPVGSVVVARGLSCPKACGTFPDEGSNPYSLHWQALDHQGSPKLLFFTDTKY